MSAPDDTMDRRDLGELRLSEAMFAGIVAIAADGIISVDEEQYIILFNRGAEQIFGYSAAEAIGQPLELLIPERLRPGHQQHVDAFGDSAIAARRMGERGEIVGRRKGGEVFPAEASISHIEVGGRRIFTAVLRDISERKRADRERAELLQREQAARGAAELAERRATFISEASALLAGSLDYEATLAKIARLTVPRLADCCIVDILAEDGSVRRLDVVHADAARADAARRLRDFPPRDSQRALPAPAIFSGRSVLVPSVTDDVLVRASQSEGHLAALREIDPVSFMAAPIIAREQSLGAITCVRTNGGSPYGPLDLALLEEIGRRAGLAVDNARLYDQARRATQARDDVLGVVSHDLRNPLSAINMCASALLESPADGAGADSSSSYLLQTIQRSAEWMQRLIQDLLDVTSIEAGRLSVERHETDVRPLVESALELFEANAAEQRVRLEAIVADELPRVTVDGQRILQVLANLIGNALKFTPEGGSVTVRAQRAADDTIRISVADTGVGIPAEQIPHLFDRFWYARRNAKQRGSGLGLAIAEGIVEAHGGRIEVESTPGVGSVFTVVLTRG